MAFRAEVGGGREDVPVTASISREWKEAWEVTWMEPKNMGRESMGDCYVPFERGT